MRLFIVIKINNYNGFLNGERVLDDDKVYEILSKGMYRPDTIEEVIVAFKENSILSGTIEFFNDWAREECLKIK